VQLFGAAGGGAAALGQSVLVEGQPFTVIGVVDQDQPFRPEWDIASTSENQDALYLPLPWAQTLHLWPERALQQSPVAAPRGQTVWASDAIFVSFWAELPTASLRAAYSRYLDQQFGPRGVEHQLRRYVEWQLTFPMPASDAFFFTALLGLGLLGAGFTTARLLLAKGLARREELGIHRALGATRAALFGRQLIEAAIIALPAALLGLLIAVGQNRLFNRVALGNDIPVTLNLAAALLGGGPAFLVGLLAAVYPAWRMSRTPPTITLGRL
jgi:putative ABC transport system permease protein